MKFPSDHVSFSQLTQFMFCNAKWFFKYVEGMRDFYNSKMMLGSSVDAGLSVNFEQKVESHEDAPIDMLLDVFDTEFEELAGKNEVQYGKNEDHGSVKDEGADMVRIYHEDFSPSIQPVAAQRRQEGTIDIFDLRTGEPMEPMKIVSYPDVLTKNDIVELKTTKTMPKGITERYKWELTIQNATRDEETVNPKLMVDYILRPTKTIQARCYRFSMGVSAEYERYVSKLVNIMAQAVKYEVILPNRDHWSCGPVQCGYWDACHKEF